MLVLGAMTQRPASHRTCGRQKYVRFAPCADIAVHQWRRKHSVVALRACYMRKAFEIENRNRGLRLTLSNGR